MTTLTINVDPAVENEFRTYARQQSTTKKGFLGKAITEAMQIWLREKKQKEISKRQLALLKKGFAMGKMNYSSREELHER